MMVLRHRWHILAVLAIMALGLVTAACGGGGPASAASGTQPPAATNLIIDSDLVEGGANIPQGQAASRDCVMTNQFPRNSAIVFRARVYDPKTGNVMDDTQLASVQVKMSNGQTVDLIYKARPKNPPNEYFWQKSWVVPKDAPTGTLSYTIVATTKDGRTGTFKPIAVPESQITILDQTFPDATTN